MNGWFPIQHDIVDSPVFHDAESLRLFVWLSKRAAISTQRVSMQTGRGASVVTLQRGQCIVGRKKGGELLGWSEDRFRYRLEKLEEWELIRRIPATHWTVIEVVNYGVSGKTNENSPQPNANQTPNQTPHSKRTKKTKNQNKNTSLSKLRFDEKDLNFAEKMLSKIRDVLPKTKDPNLKNWASTIRLMREQDSLTYEEIRQVFLWANADDFWSTNIASPKSLRNHFATLHAKSLAASQHQTSRVATAEQLANWTPNNPAYGRPANVRRMKRYGPKATDESGQPDNGNEKQ
ncbi:hypothetical protein Q31b_19710 [Novipirellula aureliae]|uniref:Uncharacterized protein n=1 Tax=Novipirellula aureliae TaxID=2527966 RepID=A0A5C6E258_9BACT|nr:hypothetical protein Q31b_19710 [Novipirellula aureliae]